MGVKGLLPCLQSITRSVSLERYRGLTAAVDAMSWLHKGVFASDVKSLAQSQRSCSSEKCSSAELRCVKYAMDKAEILRVKFGIEVLMVIDGDSLPSKKEENAQRRKDRDDAFEKALAAEKARDCRAARRFYAQSCSVDYKIRYELMKACKQARISFIVAPYEADAQMARLAHTGVVDLVITEDSDILAYGCPRALFKIDFDTCQGQEIQLMRDLGENEVLSFKNWTHDMFVFMCILSGCDYCKGVSGIGIKLAHKLVRVHRSPSKIFTALRAAGRMPSGFEDEFWVAFRTFRHQRVFCPSKQQIEPLFPIPGSNSNSMEVWSFLGEYIAPNIAAQIADGTLHPSKKIEWDLAFKRSINHDNKFGPLGDIQIHHRSPPRKQRRKENESKISKTDNIWHSLVYGNDGTNDSRQLEGKPDRLSANNASSKEDMFRFFSHSSKQKDDGAIMSRDRPPLNEIYVDENGCSNDAMPSKIKKVAPPPPGHKDLPIHFHEYKSYLVGNKFKPITQRRLKRANNGTRSTEAVQRIWEKSCSLKAQAPPEQENYNEHNEGPRHDEKGRGIAIFSKANNPCAAPVQSPSKPLNDDYCSTFSSRDLLHQMNENSNQNQSHMNIGCSPHTSDHRRQSHQQYASRSRHCDSTDASYFEHQKRRSDDHSKHLSVTYDQALYSMQRHDQLHEMGDFPSVPSPKHYERSRRTERHSNHAEVSYHKQMYERRPDSSYHYDLKSLTSGYTTVEPESYTNESPNLEYPSFPDDCDNSQHCDFEDSLQAVLDATENQGQHHHHDDYSNDYESIGVFQVFQNQLGDGQSSRVKSRQDFGNVTDDRFVVDHERDELRRCQSSNHDQLYDVFNFSL